MINIFLWILAEMFCSIWGVNRKKAVESWNVSKNLFSILWPINMFLIIYTIIFFTWSDFAIFKDYKAIILMLVIWFLWVVSNYAEIFVFKNTRMSELLPYSKLDKLFVIVIWFFYFSNTSETTLLISIFTVLLLIWFSIDFKKLKVSKFVLIYIMILFSWSIITLITWKLLLTYSTIDFMSMNSVMFIILYFSLILIYKEKPKSLLLQSKTFYISRGLALFFGSTWFLIWLYIIQNSWVVIATLISFVWVFTSIISMKYILKDNPKKKDVILAILVLILIWLWYYFNQV
jgi:hypothetical protein